MKSFALYQTVTIKLIKDNPVFSLVLLSIIIKTIQLFGIPVLTTSDTHGYFSSAVSYWEFNKNDFALRMPLYPLFIYFIAELSDKLFLIVFIQQILSVVSMVFVFKLFKLFTNDVYSLWGSVLFLLNPISIYNSYILTESIGLSLSIIFFFYYIKELGQPDYKNVLYLSIILTLMILLRPQFVFYLTGIIALPFFSKMLKTYYLIKFIPFAGLIIWMLFVYNYSGHFTVTNLIGYNLINHTGKFIDYADPKYDFIKNDYLIRRDEKMKERGNQYFAIYDIDDSIKTKYNLSTVELSHILKDMSIKLILYHPFEYLKSVWAALKFSLLIPSFEGEIKSSALFLFKLLQPVYQIVLGFGLTIVIVYSIFIKNTRFNVLYFLISLTLLSSIIFDCSENARYFIYSYPLIFIFVILGIESLIKNRVQS